MLPCPTRLWRSPGAENETRLGTAAGGAAINMKIYESDDRGDRFIVVRSGDSTREQPLAKVLRFRSPADKAHARICQETAEALKEVAEHLEEAVAALVATNRWRVLRGPVPDKLSATARAHLDARDPAVRTVLRVRHAVTTAVRALLALEEQGTTAG